MPEAVGNRRSPGRRAARIGLLLGLCAPALAVLGAWLAHRELVSPYVGFRVFLLSLPLSIAAVIVCAVALFLSRSTARLGVRLAAFAGLVAAVATTSAIAGLAAPGASYPAINDITTDLDDPPAFVAAVALQPEGRRDMSYPREFAELQRQGYPALGPKIVSASPDLVFDRVLAALEELPDTRVIDAVRSEGRIEAVATSRIFRFSDDVVVRLRPVANGTRVDVRSRSRDGKSDLGVNAARIENLLTLIHE